MKALDQMEKLSQTDDEKMDVWFMRGAMFEKMKKIDQAEAEFRKILQVKPDFAGALNYLGYMLADRGVRLNEALQMITKAVEQEPANGAYLDSLGWVYYKMGRLPEAEENIRKALETTPRDATVHDHLGDVLMRESKVREAVAQWEISVKEWNASSPADLEPAEVAKVKNKLDGAKVRLAKEVAEAELARPISLAALAGEKGVFLDRSLWSRLVIYDPLFKRAVTRGSGPKKFITELTSHAQLTHCVVCSLPPPLAFPRLFFRSIIESHRTQANCI